MLIELVQSLADLHGGRGGYWEDRGYELVRGDLRSFLQTRAKSP